MEKIMAKENFLPPAIGPAKVYKDILSLLFLIALFGFFSFTAEAAPLKVGVHEKPPFAIKNIDGSWSGLAIDVWQGVARNAGLSYELVEVPYEQIRQRVADGTLDAAVGEIDVTAQDQKVIDFTQPYLISTLGVAVKERKWRELWEEAIEDFFNWTVGRFIVGIFFMMLLVSLVIWLLERRHHTGHFKGGIDGIGSALWFAAVTMTTVGYGDKTPATPLGRLIAIGWMFVGVLMVSAFTATVASSMSAARIDNSITRFSDFRHISCGVLKDSQAQHIATRFGVNIVGLESIEDGLRQLARRELQAVFSDKISLLYLQRKMAHERPPVRFEIPQFTIRSSFLAIPVRKNHPDFDKINESLLELTSSVEWDGLLARWIGPDHIAL